MTVEMLSNRLAIGFIMMCLLNSALAIITVIFIEAQRRKIERLLRDLFRGGKKRDE